MKLDIIDTAYGVTAEQPGRQPVILSIISPTFNERDNVPVLVEKLDQAMQGYEWELVFVDDDSKDGTGTVLVDLAQENRRVRVIRRIGRRGLSTAVIEGALATTAPFIAVIDADLQHDETLLPRMLEMLKAGSHDLVVASRYVDGGDSSSFDRGRQEISSIATRLARLVIKSDVSDPMSGFFMITRTAFDDTVRQLSGQGYKILLDLLASASEPLRTTEIPYRFRTRHAGESKLDSMIVWEYLMLLADKLVGRWVPARFLMFSLVGASGVFIHMGVLSTLVAGFGAEFTISQSVATITAMTYNFFVNNTLTYRDRRLKGGWELTKGLASFFAVCSLGAIANIGVANYMFDAGSYSWWLAGFSGILIGAVWNYVATSFFTWKQ